VEKSDAGSGRLIIVTPVNTFLRKKRVSRNRHPIDGTILYRNRNGERIHDARKTPTSSNDSGRNDREYATRILFDRLGS